MDSLLLYLSLFLSHHFFLELFLLATSVVFSLALVSGLFNLGSCREEILSFSVFLLDVSLSLGLNFLLVGTLHELNSLSQLCN